MNDLEWFKSNIGKIIKREGAEILVVSECHANFIFEMNKINKYVYYN